MNFRISVRCMVALFMGFILVLRVSAEGKNLLKKPELKIDNTPVGAMGAVASYADVVEPAQKNM